MDAYVVYEGRHGKARLAAEVIGEKAEAMGIASTVRSRAEADIDALRASRALVLGCTVATDTPFGGEARDVAMRWIDALPDLNGKPVALYCTYSFFPHTFADVTARTAEVLDLLTRHIEERGGKVVAARAILNRRLATGAEALVVELSDHLIG